MIRKHALAVAAIVLVALPGMELLSEASRPIDARAASGDWPTYLHDQQRTAANLDETTLSPANAGQLVKLWSFATGGVIASSATVVDGAVYFGSWDGYEYSLDAASGALRWKTLLGTTKVQGCFPPFAGVTSTAAVQGNVVYVGGGDSYWYALDATSGGVLWKVFTGDNSASGGHYNWSSPLLFNGFAYIGVASFGDCPLVPGQLLKVDLSTHQIVNTFNAVPSGEIGGGIWTSPSVDPATNTIFVTTGSPGSSGQLYSQAVIALDADTLAVRSSWKIPAADAVGDSDWSTSPILFNNSAGSPLVASMNKNGNLYAFNRNNLAAGPVWQKLVAFGGDCPSCGDASVSSAAFANGMLFAAGGNTTIGGAGHLGSVRALNPSDGAYLWEHPDPYAVIAAVAYANGLVFAGAGPVLEVLDATSGARLYSYVTGDTVFGAPSISNGRVYAGSVDGKLYAWGLPAIPPSPPPPDPSCPGGWTCQDVGAPSPAGSETVAGSTWSINAGGAGLGGTTDQFRAVTQMVTGDGQVRARPSAQQAQSGLAQAGLIVRQSADATSPFYGVFFTPNGLTVQYRTTPGGGSPVSNTVVSALPAFLEIQRVGDQFQAAVSSDGTSYTLIPGTTVSLVLPQTALLGVAVSSGVNGTASSAVFDAVAVGSPGPAPSPQPPASPCPTGWSCSDIGNPARIGDQSLSGGTWTVQGGGNDIWDASDQFHFVWQPLAADGTVSARVASQTNTDPWAKAGVMLRQTADAGSAYYALEVTPSNGIVVQYRAVGGLRAQQVAGLAGTVPAYVRVARSGNVFSAYTSSDGVNWTSVAGSSVTLSLSGGMLAGLAVTSHNGSVLSTVSFDGVGISSSAPPPPGSCPSGWNCADVGGATPTGSQSLSNGTWTIQGGGGDIWGTSDQFHFVWQPLAADGTVSARVASQTNTDPWAKAGVMLRQSADAGSAYYALEVTPANGIVVQYRASAGANAVWLVGVAGTVPAYVRVARSGNVFSAYTSSDGVNWTNVAGSSVTLSLSGGMLAGLAVTSHNGSVVSTVSFDGVGMSTSAPTLVLPKAPAVPRSQPTPTPRS